MPTAVQTKFKLPGYVVSDGEITGNPWSYPDNILYVDGFLTESNVDLGSASDIIVGGFNPNLPADAVVLGIEIQLIAKAGADTVPPTTITLYAVDNTSGSDVFYPYTVPIEPPLSLSSIILGDPTYLFGQGSLTPEQVNNLKLQLVANGDVSVDSILLNVYYYLPNTPTPPGPESAGCPTCNSPIQIPEMFLQLPFQYGDTEFYLTPGSMQYPDGTPVQPGDIGACGGELDFVFDQGQLKGLYDSNFEENVKLDLSTGYWEVLPSGVVHVVLGSTDDRGLLPYTPYTHQDSLMSDHNANTKVIISNNARFYSRFRRTCSEPTQVYNEIVAGTGNTFTLANVPTTGTVRLYSVGTRIFPSDIVSIVGAVITFVESWPTGSILADYQY